MLFDEIEKAHPDVFNLLLQILEDGQVTDAKGRKVDFRNTVIIMTSNVGASDLHREAGIGFKTETADQEKKLEIAHAKTTEKVMGDLKKAFRPEFLNRIDKVIVFKTLSQNDLKQILNLQLAELQQRLVESELKLKVTATAKAYLMEKGYDMEQGARPMRRTIQEHLEDPLAHGLLSGEFEAGDTVKVSRHGDALELRVEAVAKAK
jgi:ATP-dependent Clp protease ATP-binding subunit ClpC